MKTERFDLCSLLFVLSVATLTLGIGCATSSSTRSGGAYELKQTRDDVDWAMTRYNNRLAFGFVTTEEQQQVSTAYKAYQTAFNATAKSANMDLGTKTPANV
jgi:hypothetical protein